MPYRRYSISFFYVFFINKSVYRSFRFEKEGLTYPSFSSATITAVASSFLQSV